MFRVASHIISDDCDDDNHDDNDDNDALLRPI